MCLNTDFTKRKAFYEKGFNKNNERIVYKELTAYLINNEIILASPYKDYVYKPGKIICDTGDNFYNENISYIIHSGIYVYTENHITDNLVSADYYCAYKIDDNYLISDYSRYMENSCVYICDICVKLLAYKHRLISVGDNNHAAFYSVIFERKEYNKAINKLRKLFNKYIKEN